MAENRKEIWIKKVKWDFSFLNSKPIGDCNATWGDIWFLYLIAIMMIPVSIFIMIGHLILARKVYFIKSKEKLI